MNRRGSLLLVPWLGVTLGCSLGQGTGEVRSDALFVRDCWGTPPPSTDPTHAKGDPYQLNTDDLGRDMFYAASPYRNTMDIRVQRGTDLTEVSDGLAVLIDDIASIRDAITAGTNGGDVWVSSACPAAKGAASAKFRVALPAGVHPPGSSTVPPPDALASVVHMSLYLERSCHIQNTVLYGIDGTISFRALFDGDPNETSAEKKLIDANFDVQFADIHDAPPGAYAGDVPPGLQSRVTGCFRFYFQRGQPAQPFP